jgi:hypothetical protein
MHRRRRRGCCARCLLLLMSSAGRTRATCFCTWGVVASRRGPDGSATASTLMSIQEEQVADRPTLSATAARYQRLQRLCHPRSRSHSPMVLEVLLWHSPPACAGSRRAVSPISRLYALAYAYAVIRPRTFSQSSSQASTTRDDMLLQSHGGPRRRRQRGKRVAQLGEESEQEQCRRGDEAEQSDSIDIASQRSPVQYQYQYQASSSRPPAVARARPRLPRARCSATTM